MADQISRLVVLSPNWLGDAVMSLPALADIRRHFSDAALAVAARPGLVPLFDSVPGVDEVVPLAGVGGTRKRSSLDVRLLKAGHFDLAILFPNSFYTAWIVKRAGVPERWGYRADFRGALLTRAVRRRPRGTIHRAEYYQTLVRALGMLSGLLRPDVLVSDRDRSAAAKLLEREGWTRLVSLVGLAPGAAFGFAKQWPAQYFGAVAASLARQGIWCVLVGLPADRDVGQQVMAASERSDTSMLTERPTAGSRLPAGRVLNLIGRTDLHQLMGLMTHCGSVVANDSGAGYLAAAIGLPVVAIFGPTDVRVAAPLPAPNFTGTHASLSHPVFCSPCWLRDCPIDHRCMKRIAPARVFDAVMQQLVMPAAPETWIKPSRGVARGEGVR